VVNPGLLASLEKMAMMAKMVNLDPLENLVIMAKMVRFLAVVVFLVELCSL
jgi:hypothetical protein